MAKSPDDQPKKKNKGTSALTWLMTGMLILGLGGFGVSNFGGTINSIGSVGKIDIPVRDYAQAVRDEAAKLSQQYGTQIPVQQAITFGIDRQALAGLVTRAALDNAALSAGLSVGDATVAQEVMKERAFIGSSGSFDRSVYREALSRAGWREADFEESLRRDAARALLSGAVTGGFAAPEATTDAIYKWVAERRGFSLIRLTETSLTTPLTDPDEAALKAWYDANIADFTRGESKRLRYAVLLPETIATGLSVDEAAIRKMYDARISEFVIPPRRLVERLVYPDEAAREAALARLTSGEATFEDLVTARGLSMDAVDMGDVSETELGAAGAEVFAAAEGAVIPAETSLGPALFRINGVLPGEETTFEEAHDDLAQEVKLEAARLEINHKIDEIDDLLAGGASLDELSTQTGMELGQIDYVATGPGAQTGNKLEGYQAFRTAAGALKQGDFPEAVTLDDGGVVAMEFVETVPPTPIPFEEARSEVLAALQQSNLRAALDARGLELKTAAESGADFATLGTVETVAETSRDGATTENIPAPVLEAAFAMRAGDIRLIEDGSFIGLLRLDHVTAAAETGDEAEALKAAISSQLEQAVAQDAFTAFTTSVADKAGMTLNQNAINQVNSGLQ
ncbi:peptidylprolyl isomerase [Paracoccus sp. IB05]|uniref:peptidylprolyl isomerase n=1 Tax=Paracoccus sp. IB05 TaxID=2779367 RepID=UPI0018E71348|nr:peptidylprolyl isomerase [Paracoccus sp. IB05]MBJ2153973.1 peptidyl-prolyl cis-trans isomerase [Paracoccus sp. IB05]